MTVERQSGFGSYSLEHVALGLLMAGPKHGYGLYQDFEDAFAQIWRAGQTNFYLALTAVEDKGYAHPTTEPQEGRPPRKVYHLTDAGRDAFLAWLHAPVLSMRAIRVEFIAKLRLFRLLRLPGADALIDRQIAALQTMLDEWEAAQASRQQRRDPFRGLIADFRRRQATFIIEWLEAWKEHIQNGVPTG